MNGAQLVFLSIMSGLALLVIAGLVFTDLVNRLPRDLHGFIRQGRK